jgi:hypothetical protein
MIWLWILAIIAAFILGAWLNGNNRPKPDSRVFGHEKQDWHHDQCHCMNDQDEAMCDLKACGRCDGFDIK